VIRAVSQQKRRCCCSPAYPGIIPGAGRWGLAKAALSRSDKALFEADEASLIREQNCILGISGGGRSMHTNTRSQNN